ncbi:hypothetical protein FQN53_001944 [Emmonsiellopsis sp. PD_33]|nr:hypothetical protein FQN53_001944 [Emmonsiellopsis sp. PD_33]
MQFFKYLFFIILPVVALSMPAAQPEPKFDLASLGPLLNSRADIGGLLDGLLGSLDGIKKLLSEESINNINIVLSNAAKLLDDDGTKKLKTVVTNANNLLTADLVKTLNGLFKDIAPLIQAVVKVISMLVSSLLG